MGTGVRQVDQQVYVEVFSPAVPSSATPIVLSFKGYDHVTFMIRYKNATTVTGTAVTLNQGTGGAGTTTLTGTKALAFTKMHAGVNTNSSHALVETAVVSNTFTTDATNSQSGLYFVDMSAINLDVANLFNCIQIGLGNATAATIQVWALLGPSPRYAGGYDSFLNPLV